MDDWTAFYDAQAGRDPRPTIRRALEFRDAAPGFALDLGAGEGSDTRFLLQQGWRVHAIDGADGAIDRIRSNVPSALRAKLTVEQRVFESDSFVDYICSPELDERSGDMTRSEFHPAAQNCMKISWRRDQTKVGGVKKIFPQLSFGHPAPGFPYTSAKSNHSITKSSEG